MTCGTVAVIERCGLRFVRLSVRCRIRINTCQEEAGSAPIPVDKLKKLAKVLKRSPEAILGRHPPINADLYDDSVGEDLNYYGEESHR